ncbi:MAG TPA: WG repeat-containing protein [Spirochaetes bacterium]|nr:WG repeat-containing protein [Spirochaetota bacterium]
MDITGKTIIPFIYENADSFFKGLCPVKKDGKYGCINKKGETVIPFLYDDIDYFNNGFAVFTKEDKKGVIDNSGKIIIEPQYDELFEHEGCFVAADWILKNSFE